MNRKNKVFIGIGSNLKGHMCSSKKIIDIVLYYISLKGLRVVRKSSIYKSKPNPLGLGPSFYNRVILVESAISALSILSILNSVENNFGRKRKKYKNMSRILDLDIIDCRRELISNNLLSLPHPRINERDFVLRPLLEIEPNWIHPKNNKKIKSLLVKNNRYSINKATKINK